jgi:hypothetical protein
MNLILQVVHGLLRYKHGGSQQPRHYVLPVYAVNRVQEVEGPNPLFLLLVAHSLPTIILAKARRNEACSSSPLSLMYGVVCDSGGEPLLI